MSNLDFIVWGVPRSGTSPLRHAINLHPAVFCGHEHHAALQPALARMPDAFLTGDGAICTPETVRDTASELRAKMEAGPVRLYGDKSPHYYLYPDRLSPALRQTAIYRSPRFFPGSWDARAADPGDAHWPEWQVGLLSLVDWLLFLDTVATYSDRVTLISYQALFNDDPELFPRYMAMLTGEPAPAGLQAAFAPRFFRSRPPDNRRPEVHPYKLILREIGADALDTEVRTLGMVAGAAVASRFRQFVDAEAWRVAYFVRGRLTHPKVRPHLAHTAAWCRTERARYAERRRQSQALLAALDHLAQPFDEADAVA